MSRRSHPLTWLFLALAVVFTTLPAFADASGAKQYARTRFGRGLELFNQGDNAGALAEFERAYELAPHPVVLYNIGLVQAAMGRAVEAVDSLDRLLANPSGLDPSKLERARAVRVEQQARIAEIVVTANVVGADVEVDNIKVGKTPLSGPLRVTSGTRIVGVVAPGHIPERRVVTIAGGVKKSLRFDLVTSELSLGHLALTSHVPGVSVVLDGHPVGETPLRDPITLAPGNHVLELRRPGYAPLRRNVSIEQGGIVNLALDPDVDPATLSASGAHLALDASEADVSVSVDGRRQGKYAASILLPVGRHELLVEKAGFDPVRREVTVASSGTTVRVSLLPTPDYRSRYERKAQAFRTWGIVGVVAGVVVAGAGTGYLVWNAGKKQDAKDAFNDAADQRDARVGEFCAKTVSAATCDNWVNGRYDELEAVRARDLYGYVGLGVGAAMALTGGVLLFTGDDPDRYSPARPELSKARWVPLPWASPQSVGLGAVGTF